MTDSLLDFLMRFPPPASAADLWGEINSMRLYASNPCPDLPATWEELGVQLRALAVAGLAVEQDGQWRLVPKAAPAPKLERSLF